MLVDGEIGPTKLDIQMLDWLRHHEVPHHIVATKHDKVKPSTIGVRKRDLAVACGLLPEDVTWVSAAKGTGLTRCATWCVSGCRPSGSRPAAHRRRVPASASASARRRSTPR